MNRGLMAVVAVVVIGGAAIMVWKGRSAPEDDLMTPTVNTLMHGAEAGARARPADEIVVPELSSAARLGQAAFDKYCVACHGAKAAGTENGPPFVHAIYKPGHHGDFAFESAVKGGVRAHHWRFGDMPPVAGVTDKQVEWIVTYVREMQRANGIN